MTLTNTNLKIEQSLLAARWIFTQSDPDKVERMMRMHNLPEFVSRLLINRGVTPQDAHSYLFPSLKESFPDPFSLKDMKEMSAYVSEYISEGGKIGVFGDFDVDGSTSTAVMTRFFNAISIETEFYIPDRLSEGYGPNIQALTNLKDKGCDLIFILDCGTTSHDIVSRACQKGANIIILDHHETETHLPEAQYVINPKRKDDDSGLDMLAAVGVTFLACVAINASLREKEFYSQRCLNEPDLRNYMDMVALGTVCDMVPLTGPNRLFVRKGFEYMNKTSNPGLLALKEIGKVSGEVQSYHAGFVFGPRINAGSRVHKSDLGARLLSTDDEQEALNLAWRLDDCNNKRKDIQNEMLARAKTQVMARSLDKKAAILVDDPDGHPGLAGLVAGQLARLYNKPACVVTYATNESGEREGRGSGRSVKGVNLAQAFIGAREKNLLVKGGGHEMAGGFTVKPEKLVCFYEFMIEEVECQLNGDHPVSEIYVDGLISVRGVKVEFIRLIEHNAGPFGMGNPEPVFVLPKIRVERPDIVGKNHVRCLLSDWEGGPRLKAVAFQSADTSLGQALLKSKGQAMHIAGQFKLDSWNGQERAELHITDAAFESGHGAESDRVFQGTTQSA